jgi:hypothetical protein
MQGITPWLIDLKELLPLKKTNIGRLGVINTHIKQPPPSFYGGKQPPLEIGSHLITTT